MVWQSEWNLQENPIFPPWEPQDARGRRRRRVWDSFHRSLEDVKYTLWVFFFGFNLFLSDRPADCWLLIYYITVRKKGKRVWEREKWVAHGGTIKNKNDRGMKKGSWCSRASARVPRERVWNSICAVTHPQGGWGSHLWRCGEGWRPQAGPPRRCSLGFLGSLALRPSTVSLLWALCPLLQSHLSPPCHLSATDT